MKKKSQKYIALSILFILSVFGRIYSRYEKADISYADYDNTITVVNSGQARCSLIQSEGKFCLLDAGHTSGGVDIVSYLNQRGVEEIELLVISHFHSDHTSQVPNILKNFTVKNILIPDLSEENTPTSVFYQRLLEDARGGRYALHFARRGKQLAVGSGTVTVLTNTENKYDINNTSICLTFSDKDFKMVYTGDAEAQVEEQLTALVPRNINFFIAAHHGSSDANSYDFIKTMRPDFTAISCGENNDYNHPHRETIETFEKLGIDYAITWQHGNIVYSMAENKLLELE